MKKGQILTFVSSSVFITGLTLAVTSIPASALTIGCPEKYFFNSAKKVLKINPIVSQKKETLVRKLDLEFSSDNLVENTQWNNGPKKVIPASYNGSSKAVPEPVTILGTMFAGSFGYLIKRKQKTA